MGYGSVTNSVAILQCYGWSTIFSFISKAKKKKKRGEIWDRNVSWSLSLIHSSALNMRLKSSAHPRPIPNCVATAGGSVNGPSSGRLGVAGCWAALLWRTETWGFYALFQLEAWTPATQPTAAGTGGCRSCLLSLRRAGWCLLERQTSQRQGRSHAHLSLSP